MKRKSPAARRHAEDRRAAARLETQREKEAARAASATGTGPQSVSSMKGPLLSERQKKREAKKAARESAQA